MAPKGHIKLGTFWDAVSETTDFRPYILKDIVGFGPSNANPFAAPSGGNQGYNDLEGWAEWTMRDWQAGVNQKDAEAGGLRFAVGDSRVPGQLSPAPAAVSIPATTNDGTYRIKRLASGTVSIGTAVGDAGTKIAFATQAVDGDAPGAYAIGLLAYCIFPPGAAATVKIYADSAGSLGSEMGDTPNGELPYTVYGTNTTPAMRLENLLPIQAGQFGNGLDGATYWVEVAVTAGTIVFATSAVADGGSNYKVYSSSSWGATVSDPKGGVITPCFAIKNGATSGELALRENTSDNHRFWLSSLFSDGSDVYWLLTGQVNKYNSATNTFGFDALVTPTTQAVGRARFAGHAYFCAGGDLYRYAAATATSITAPYTVTAIHSSGGYLWIGTSDGIIAYTADDTTTPTWTVIDAGSDDIFCIATVGDYTYFATESGVYYVAPGDFVVPLMGAPSTRLDASVSNLSETRMEPFDGSLFLTLGGEVYRVDQSHTVIPVSPMRHSDCEEFVGQRAVGLSSSQTYLFLLTTNESGAGFVFSYQPEGWHCIASVPVDGDRRYGDLLYVQSIEKLFVAGRSNVFVLTQSAIASNPFYDTGQDYAPQSWFETPPFYGAVYRLQKDFESVFMDMDGPDEGDGEVEVYYKERVSGSGWGDWTLLGEATSNEAELRFDNYATNRKERRTIRLGFLLKNYATGSGNVRINAISTKYVPMVTDRWKWVLNIEVPYQLKALNGEWLIHPTDATATTYTQDEVIAHLETLRNSVVPIYFEDTTGEMFEVKVSAITRQIERYDVDSAGGVRQAFIYSVAIEQVNDDEYTPPA